MRNKACYKCKRVKPKSNLIRVKIKNVLKSLCEKCDVKFGILKKLNDKRLLEKAKQRKGELNVK